MQSLHLFKILSLCEFSSFCCFLPFWVMTPRQKVISSRKRRPLKTRTLRRMETSRTDYALARPGTPEEGRPPNFLLAGSYFRRLLSRVMNRWTSYKTSSFVTGCVTGSFSTTTIAQGISLRLRYNPRAPEGSNPQTTALSLAPEHRGWLYITLVCFSSLIYNKAGARLTIQNFKIPLITVPNFA